MIQQAGLEPNAELLRIGVPSIWDTIKGENRKIAEVVIAQQEFHRPFLAPPGVAAGPLGTLRKAFMATLADGDFLVDATKMKLSITPKDGEAVVFIGGVLAEHEDVVADHLRIVARIAPCPGAFILVGFDHLV